MQGIVEVVSPKWCLVIVEVALYLDNINLCWHRIELLNTFMLFLLFKGINTALPNQHLVFFRQFKVDYLPVLSGGLQTTALETFSSGPQRRTCLQKSRERYSYPVCISYLLVSYVRK